MSSISMSTEPDFPNLILLHAFTSTRFMVTIAPKLEDRDFFDEGERAHKLAWNIARDYFMETRRLIPRAAFETELSARLRGNEDYLSDMDVEAMQLLLDIGYAPYRPEDLFPERMIPETSKFMEMRRASPIAAAMAATADPEEYSRLFEEMTQARRSSVVSSGIRAEGFRPGALNLRQLPRTACGFTPFDELLGGTRPEVCGLLGPSGGGKSVTAVHFAWEHVRTRRHTAYFAYENPFNPEYNTRFYGFAAGIPSERIMGRSVEELLPSDRQRIEEEIEQFGSWFHPFDMLSNSAEGVGFGGVAEVDAQLDQLSSDGCRPDAIVIDQYLPQITRYMASKGLSDDQLRKIMQSTVDDYVRLADKYQTFVLLLHQLNPDAGNKPPYVRPKWGDSAECRSFAFWLQNCLALGTADQQGRAWMIASKVRGGAKGEIIVQLNGGNFRLDYQKDKFRLDHRRFVDVNEEEDRSIPTSQPQPQAPSPQQQRRTDAALTGEETQWRGR